MLKSKNTKFLMLAAAAAMLIPAAASHSASTSIGASATFLSALSLGTPTNLAFSTITYSVPVASTDKLTLTTASGATYGGVWGAGPTAAPAAGSVTITGSNGAGVSVTCTTSATLSDGLGHSIVANTLRISDVTQKAAGGVLCSGSPLTFTLSAADSTLFLGGVLDGSTAIPAATFPGGIYNTTNSGGTPVTVTVAYQ